MSVYLVTATLRVEFAIEAKNADHAQARGRMELACFLDRDIEAHYGEVAGGPAIAAGVTHFETTPPTDVVPPVDLGLTGAEARVLRYLCAAKTANEIAAALGKSPHTIRNQTKRVYEKMRVNSHAALVARCADLGILGVVA